MRKLLFLALFIISLKYLPRLKNKAISLVFFIKEYFDPTPGQKRGEIELDWYRRIGPDYALRQAEYNYHRTNNLDSLCFNLMNLGFIEILPNDEQILIKNIINSVKLIKQETENNLQNALYLKRYSLMSGCSN